MTLPWGLMSDSCHGVFIGYQCLSQPRPLRLALSLLVELASQSVAMQSLRSLVANLVLEVVLGLVGCLMSLSLYVCRC